MTFIQPHKQSNILGAILVVLILALGAGIFGMVALYNATVNASANIAHAKAEMDAIGARSTDMQNKIVATLGGNALAKIAAARGLVIDGKPQYFPLAAVNPKWPIASHY